MLTHERRLVMSQMCKGLPKGKTHPRTDHEGSQGE